MMLVIEAVARAPILLENYIVSFGFGRRRYHRLELNRRRGMIHQEIVSTVRGFAREKHPTRAHYGLDWVHRDERRLLLLLEGIGFLD